jgi:hypothetical protein
MAMDHDRLIQIAAELKSLDQRRVGLLAELGRIAQGTGGASAIIRRRPGRPPGSRNNAKPPTPAPSRPGRLPRSLASAAPPSRAELVVHRGIGRRKKGLTTAIVDLLQGTGAAYTAGDIVRDLKLPKTKSQISSVSTTMGRLVKEGRAKKDEERGYLAA